MPLRPREINDSLSSAAITALIRESVKREVRRLNTTIGSLDHGALLGLSDDDHTQYLTETRHDALPADNPHSLTFTQAVTADGGTDILASEAETLTDGSNADALHVHAAIDGADHGALLGLGDDDHSAYVRNVTGTFIDGTIPRLDGTGGRDLQGAVVGDGWVILDNQRMIAPTAATFDLGANGVFIVFDADGDSSVGSFIDDIIVFATGGVSRFSITNVGVFYTTLINLLGNELVFDSDGDTSISSAVDDILVFATGGSTRMTLTNTELDFNTAILLNHLELILDNEGLAKIRSNAVSGDQIEIEHNSSVVASFSNTGINFNDTVTMNGVGIFGASILSMSGPIDMNNNDIDTEGGDILLGTGLLDTEGGIIQSGGALIDSEGGIIDTGGANLFLGSSPGTESGVLDFESDGTVTIRSDAAAVGYIFKSIFDIFKINLNECKGLFSTMAFGGAGNVTYELDSSGSTKMDTTGGGASATIRFTINNTSAGQFQLVGGEANFTAPLSVTSPGNALILSGGFTTSTVGGDLRLRPGVGSTTGGNVLFEDETGSEIARVDSVVGAFIVDTILDINAPIAFGIGNPCTLGNTTVLGPGTTQQNEWVQINVNGNTRWIAVWA